jgi:hypothetical protein
MKKSLLLLALILSSPAKADPLVQQFKSPSFNGYGWSQHVQAIDAQERSREQSIRDAEAAKAALAKAEASNTPLAKFMALFTSQVYAQLATQLSNNLFAEGSGNSGTLKFEDTTIVWSKDTTAGTVTLNISAPTGNTEIIIPLASVAF